MASTQNPLGSDLLLTPLQQRQLFEALNPHKPAGFQETPLVDYDYDFQGGDASYDFRFAADSQTNMIMPGSHDSDSRAASGFGSDKGGSDTNENEKRSHPDDHDDDEEGNAKRQETGDKVAKKPGRKPLTTEPTSRRKAQNRAAQRAFRERKEKHVKDLEIKVEELEKASQSATQENSKLRAQVERMQVELSEYKKRLSVLSTTRNTNVSGSAGKRATFGNAVIGNLNDVNFQFEFPKFGQLPGPTPSPSVNSRLDARPSMSPSTTQSSTDSLSPSDKTGRKSLDQSSDLGAQTKENLATLSGIFSPPLTDNLVASAAGHSQNTQGIAASISSPSCSSNSNGGPNSSCGTSPEPTTNQSPTTTKRDALGTIGEEYPSILSVNQDLGHFANLDYNNMSLLTNTDFQFDPQLFGGYREPQQNILSNSIDDGFFNDAFEIDFTTPYFAPSQAASKRNLMAQIDEAKDEDQTELVPTDDGKYLTCNKIWEKLQKCPRVQRGDFDLDGLCQDLQKKAKCTGTSTVVDEQTFKNVMEKYLGRVGGDCPNDVPPEVLQAYQAQEAERAASLC